MTVRSLHAPTLVVVAAGVVLWSALAPQVGPYLLPSPTSVLSGLVNVVASGQLGMQVGSTLVRVGTGFCIALGIALATGFAAARFHVVREVARDLTAMLNSTSVFVWIVLAMIWFGLSNTAPMFTTCMIVLPVLLSTVLEGIDSVDRKLLEMARVYRLSDVDRFVHVIVPATLPAIVTGMKVGFALAPRVSVVAEIFGVTSGIGYMMNMSRDTLRTDMVFVWALVLIAVMVVVEKTLFSVFERRVAAWR